MSCREFDRDWGRRLDAVRAGRPAPEPAGLSPELDAHLARCPRCRSRAIGYAALTQAIAALEPTPTPSRALTARILEAASAEPVPAPRIMPIRRGGPIARSLAIAAAVLIASWVGIRAFRPGPSPAPEPGPARPSAPGPVASAPPRPLAEAVAEAAEAAGALARKTSEPAARFGRGVLVAASGDDATDIGAGGPADPPGPIPDEDAATRVVELIGEGLEAGVRPLSRPTRSAFGFLLPSLPRADDAAPGDRGV